MIASEWSVRRRAPQDVLDSLRVDSPLLAQLLLNRGVNTASEAAEFISSDVQNKLVIGRMAGLDTALARIRQAVDARERVVVYGDYDVDGLSGSTLLQLALKAVGADVQVFIPHRERDGYGLQAHVLDALSTDRIGLVISVDCGISAADEIAAATGLGLDVIITDHHQVPERLPEAVAVINPHQPDCPYPFKQLAGAGVALRLAEAVLRELSSRDVDEEIEERLYELACLGTIADVMPLVGENRRIVQRGLRRLNSRPAPGLAALVRRSRIEPGDVTASSIAFRLAPRINAAGRIDDAILAHRLLSSESDAAAGQYADQLDEMNRERRALTDDALERACAEILADPALANGAVVVAGDYPLGVVGLVAARLSGEYGLPAAVIRRDEELCRGSVRGIAGFNTVEAVRECGAALLGFGGHAGAAGMTLRSEDIDEFRYLFQRASTAMLVGAEPPPPPQADCRLLPSRLRPHLLELLDLIEPCGEANSSPLFETRDMLVRDVRVVGERHTRMALEADGARVTGIMFNEVGRAPSPGQYVDVLYHVRRNRWRGTFSIDLEIVGWRASGY